MSDDSHVFSAFVPPIDPSEGPVYYKGRAFVRARIENDRPVHELRCFGPKRKDHPSVGKPCVACGKAFAEGDLTTLVAVGPGENSVTQFQAARGSYFPAVAVELHFACAFGVPD